MNMSADIYKQQNLQSSDSGSISREWVYSETIICRVQPIKSISNSSKGDNKSFTSGKHNDYDEVLRLTMKTLVPLSKRWRIQNIRTSNGSPIYIEMDLTGKNDTIFDIVASHGVSGPTGELSHFEIILQRTRVQNDNTSSE